MTDELDEYVADQMHDAAFAAAYRRASRRTAACLFRDLAWFRVLGYGLWVKWGSDPDLHDTRQRAVYVGRLRWKVLKP